MQQGGARQRVVLRRLRDPARRWNIARETFLINVRLTGRAGARCFAFIRLLIFTLENLIIDKFYF